MVEMRKNATSDLVARLRDYGRSLSHRLRSMQQSERLGAILERLSANGSVSVAEIAA